MNQRGEAMKCLRLCHSAGFSLIEILVVLFIIVLAVGMISLQINVGESGSATELQQQVEDFLQKAQFAEDQAVLTGRPYGLVVEPPNVEHGWLFRWQSYTQGKWTAAEDVLTEQEFPEAVDLAAEVEGSAVEFDRFKSLNEEQQPLPTIVFLPGGEVTPFTMTLYNRDFIDESAMISSEITGVVELLDQDQRYDLQRFNQ